jgi:hypothetical protein
MDLVKATHAALVIQRKWRVSVSNPEFVACRKRLLFEYYTLSNDNKTLNPETRELFHLKNNNTIGTELQSKEQAGTFKRKNPFPRCRMMKMDPLNVSLS